MKKLIIAAATTAILAGCGQEPASQTAQAGPDTGTEKQTTAEPATPELTSGLLLANMNPNVKPGDDFNAYVNGAWMHGAEIAADRASNTVGLDVHEEATENVRLIIEESAEGDFPKGSDEQKVGDLYNSYMNVAARNELGMSPLERDLAEINALEDHTGLAIYFAQANKLGVSTPFALAQYVDFKDPNTYMMYTWQGGLGLPDREYYFEEDEKSQAIRDTYVEHIEKMFTLAGLPNPGESAATVMALETRMAAEHMLKEDTRDMVALYNKIPMAEVPDLMPDFAWEEYLETSGVSQIDGLVVTQLDYMKALNQIIAETDMATWKTFLSWKVLNSNAGYLTEALDQQNFDFYSNTLRGIEEPLPMWKRAVGNVNQNIGEVVGKVYVSRHFSPQAKEHMLELVHNLIRAYEISIRDLEWMGEETRIQALDKLSKFTPKIGYPDKWKDYSKLEISEDDLVGNMKRSNLFTYETNLARQDGPVDRTEWGMTPQTVNAYYNPPLNEIVFPAAILQPPYFDLGAEDAVNYGTIGAVIGHEIGHGFDDTGSTFDGDGVLRNWWTDEDRSEFESRTATLIGQYNEFEPLEGLNVNGEFTLGENIGDLGGLSIALMAYHLSLDGQEAPVMDGFTGDQRVFLGWGQGWRGIQRDEALRTQIATDPHSPRQYRINGVVRNIPEFYEAFEVSENDALYVAPEDRVKIW